MWMHVKPDKVSISKKESHHVAEANKMKNIIHDHHPGNVSHLAAKPTADTHHIPVSHRPRQLSGRHH